MNDFTIVLRSLRVRLFSTLTTILSVAIAVALIIVLLTLRNSGKASFERGAGDVHLLVSRDPSATVSVLNNIFYANAPQQFLTWDRVEKLQSEAPWQYCVPTALGDTFRAYPVVGTTPEFLTSFKPADKQPWRFTSGEAFKGNFEVVIGATVAQRGRLNIGDTIFLTHGGSKGVQGQVMEGDVERAGSHDDHDYDHDHDHDHAHDHEEGSAPHIHREFGYKVVGILAPTLTSHDRALFVNLESTWIIHAHDRRLREAKNPEELKTTAADVITEDRKVTGVLLRLVSRTEDALPANFPQVYDQLRRDTTITVANPEKEITTLFTIVDQVNRVFLAIAIVVLVSSGVSIMLALYNSMAQRRRQIAVLRVLGASQGRIFNLTLAECAMIGLAGAISGILLAYLGAALASDVLRARFGLIIQPNVEPMTMLMLAAATVVLACVAGLVPAIMAYRTSVASNLKPVA